MTRIEIAIINRDRGFAAPEPMEKTIPMLIENPLA
jgi:hypothetical protein